jgi:hypothetical protein
MKIVRIISENKKTKRRVVGTQYQQQLYQSKIGYAEAIVLVKGKLKTAHMISLKDYANQQN